MMQSSVSMLDLAVSASERLTYSRTPQLCKEHNARGDLQVLSDLEVPRETNGCRYHIVTPHRKLTAFEIRTVPLVAGEQRHT